MNAGRRTSALATPVASRSRVESNDFLARLLITLAWAMVVVPQVIESVTTPQHQESVEVAAPALTHLARLARLTLTLALIATSLWIILAAARRTPRLDLLPLVVFLAPWVFMVARDGYVTGRPGMVAFLTPILAIALWTLQPRIRCLSSLGYLTALGAALSIAMAIVDPPSAIFQSVQEEVIATDKQILPWGMLKGFLTQPNSLAKFLILGLPAVLLIPRLKWRAAAVSLCVFAVVWSASRTSLDAAVVMAAVALVLSLLSSRQSKRQFGRLAVLASMGAVCLLPFLSTSPTAFANRSFIWQASLPYWRSDPWFGQGADLYERIAKTSATIAGAAFYAHNQLVQCLVTGGLCYAILVGILLCLAAARAGRLVLRGSNFGILYLVTLAGTFTLEVSFPTVDGTTTIPIVLAPLAVIIFSRDHARHDPDATMGTAPHLRAARSLSRAPQRRVSTLGTTSEKYLVREAVGDYVHR